MLIRGSCYPTIILSRKELAGLKIEYGRLPPDRRRSIEEHRLNLPPSLTQDSWEHEQVPALFFVPHISYPQTLRLLPTVVGTCIGLLKAKSDGFPPVRFEEEQYNHEPGARLCEFKQQLAMHGSAFPGALKKPCEKARASGLVSNGELFSLPIFRTW